jgi:hypothetical protein
MKKDERRQHPRVDVVASAVILLPGIGSPARYVVEDLSVGGAMLRGGPPLGTRDPVRLVLHLRGFEPILVDAAPVRQSREGGSASAIAVAFRRLTPVQEDIIQDAILKALEALNGPASGVRARGAGDPSLGAAAQPKTRKRR